MFEKAALLRKCRFSLFYSVSLQQKAQENSILSILITNDLQVFPICWKQSGADCARKRADSV
jgi:hypothetical protein